MTDKLQDKNLDFLYEAILSLETKEDCEKFFTDLCTVKELKSISQRVVVAKMLKEKSVYSDIVEATGASCHHLPCQPLSELRRRRLRRGFSAPGGPEKNLKNWLTSHRVWVNI